MRLVCFAEVRQQHNQVDLSLPRRADGVFHSLVIGGHPPRLAYSLGDDV